MDGLDYCALAAAVVLAVPLLVLAVECVVASARRVRPTPPPQGRVPCAVLIPAHNEELGLGRTLDALAPELIPGDRVLVVADNCTDRTAHVARGRANVEVVERFDATRRGKGYALAFGVDVLRDQPPAVVVVLDADCVIGPGSLARLVVLAHETQRPVQAAYRMDPPAGAKAERGIAAFAFVVKNVVRPLGLKRLGQPCLLTGTGMAFPWPVISAAKLGHGHIVEDMQLAVDLVVAGHGPRFAPDAAVSAEFPTADAAAGGQRRRWEHGHLRVIRAGVPRLLASALKGRLSSLALALELGVPPLSALVLVAGAVLVALTGYAVFGGSPWPAAVLGTACSLAALGLTAAWLRFGRSVLPVRTLLRVPLYAVRKVPLYLGFFTKPQAEWVRTERV
ncbi:Glycosyl transferase OS=Oscillatoriales cyanobacterium JSC-12 GN=OsccyDRAFT_0485 PE=4 SV=1: Glyco_tranf_2_3 [Gemmataceae bacterium]|nr:Glycosyl transferase OS=Oscillatoriales cyanobacterium JSC-12 GN=OsccyDRAFT_0485 PE=4 SV=1: Glyco_tranf_2_3 [Gemmataceae bacterium]VTU01960.1 Glycosyl transferase OS=Oscillatoriales cyanobacterium JSC-12 GN=OsccyDRAFT_0485 PE=4 SV=1: Glyco_tranf_2_3 [Gemmataceae bacterium]